MSGEGSHCRSCGGPGLATVLSLGRTPLANALLRPEDVGRPEPIYPLDLGFCPGCGMVQLRETVPPEHLFDDYPYFSSFSDTMLAHAARLAARLTAERRLGPGSIVVEAASNDGYLLKEYRAAGVPVLGIEPARNVAAVAVGRHGIPTRVAYFGEEVAAQLAASGQRADVFHAHNVLAHVPDINGFVRGVRTILKDDGVAVLEFPYLRDLLDGGEFDTIYHEHVFYFSLTALAACLGRHGLAAADVERVAIHGGSLRVFAVPEGSARPSERVAALLAEEAGWGVTTEAPYRAFADRVAAVRAELRALLASLKARGARIAAYGASAKGTTLLSYCGIGRETLDFVADRSTVKQDRYTPGTHLPIFPPERLLADQPDYTLLLVWNFAEEVMAQQAEYVRRGGRFVVPVPVPRVVPEAGAVRAA